MTLTNRLSASFLGALALILVGFSAALFLMASVYLHRSVDERLDSTLATLTAMAEDEPGGFDWEHDRSRVDPGQGTGLDQARWIVFDENGQEIDRSANLANADRIESPGARRLDRRGIPWRVVEHRLISNHPRGPSLARPGQFEAIVLRAGLRLDPIESTLRTLAFTLTALSVGLWSFTALGGRWICRRALAPLTRMAVTSRELGTDEPGRRLPIPSTADELEDLARAFNGLLDRWHEALERQSRFAGDASHQLRTPLAALIGQVDVALRRDRPVEEYQRTLVRVRDQAERLRRIVESLLFLARADAEAALPSLEDFDLIAWLDERMARRLEDSASERHERTGLVGPLIVRSHPALLAEVLQNLLDNAFEHGQADSPVEIHVDLRGEFATLAIRDRGRGIAPGDLSQIFEPFYRSGSARRSAPGGVGLGLAVARRIILALGGTLEAESTPGSGSCFTIQLPLAPRSEAQNRTINDPRGIPDGPHPAGRSSSIVTRNTSA